MNKLISLKEGITQLNNGKYSFYWKSDSEDSIIFLEKDTSGVMNIDGINYIYGFKYNDNISYEQKSNFRKAIKNNLDDKNIFNFSDIRDFVDTGIARLDNYKRLNSFKVTVYIETTKQNKSNITSMMNSLIFDEVDGDIISFKLFKELCKDVTFDEIKAFKALKKSPKYKNQPEEELRRLIDDVVKIFNEAKENNELFQMKKYVPLPIRKGFVNFLKFKNDDDRELYRKLDKGTEVLILDDLFTSGSTIKEVRRLLNSVNPNNKLTVFTLINQNR